MVKLKILTALAERDRSPGKSLNSNKPSSFRDEGVKSMLPIKVMELQQSLKENFKQLKDEFRESESITNETEGVKNAIASHSNRTQHVEDCIGDTENKMLDITK